MPILSRIGGNAREDLYGHSAFSVQNQQILEDLLCARSYARGECGCLEQSRFLTSVRQASR